MKKIFLGLMAILIFCAGVVEAQEQKVELTAAWEELFPFKAISEWLGGEFIFRPNPRRSQEYGYMNVSTHPKKSWKCPSYGECVGKVIKVVGISPDRVIPEMWDIKFEVQGTGKKLYAHNVVDTVMNLCYLPDLIKARELFVGKTLWFTGTMLWTYDVKTDEFTKVDLKKKFLAVEVLEIGRASCRERV